MIKLEALRTFVTVAEVGGIKGASERLNRTVSAVSMTLTQLENELSAALFEQDRKSHLTDLGQFVKETATLLIRDYDRAVDLIKAYANGRTGKLRIASVPSVATHLLPSLLKDFVVRHANIDVELTDTDTSQVIRLVETAQADFGICSPLPGTTSVAFKHLFRDKFRLVCAEDDPLVQLGRPLRWDDLATTNLILNESSRSLNNASYAEVASNARLTVRNISSLTAMVGAGLGVTLLPALSCSTLPKNVVSLAFADDIVCWRDVGIVQRPNSIESPLTRVFCTHLEEQLPRWLASLGNGTSDTMAELTDSSQLMLLGQVK
ncbi:LysR family transcriptional regulator [Pandoraea terrae]|uniref:LysR family transcriptional regulator n=1 Tax=Pandoraea terrae TaxID=1537710 RepID=UPI00177F2EB4|nr:LysR family transcriptional regulator [Pandoraea terrae]